VELYLFMVCTGTASLYLRNICCSLKLEVQALSLPVTLVIMFLFLSFCSVKFIATIIELTVVLQQMQVVTGNMYSHCRGLPSCG